MHSVFLYKRDHYIKGKPIDIEALKYTGLKLTFTVKLIEVFHVTQNDMKSQ